MKISSFHVGVSAEAFAAALFARLGHDVSVQYGANQPEYDLIVAKGEKLLKVSVKGSQDGQWGLTQGYLTKGECDYHDAIDRWLCNHGSKTIFCLVQFKDVEMDVLPRVYLATPAEIASQMKKTANGRGDTILFECKEWTKRARGYGSVDAIPDEWKFSGERLASLFDY